ncbi:ATP-binding protein [Dactylosporangium siamense]|uniref:Oxygen sensor histidine kinase NreB n=1 Tax=Dactylosporangium siamense TaxID=685454 RepID=A0A919PY32_9ACTN|nr:ATP-binding protein [Dactylosporangium siamense]GIG52477.1 hypothetical protein Dsi01nite_105180 [Dactylosporangium siamense]
MAVSYMLVSAAAVLLVEVVLLAMTVPRIRDADQLADQARQRATAAEQNVNRLKAEALAQTVANAAGKAAAAAASGSPAATDASLLDAAAGGFADPAVTDQIAAARLNDWADAVAQVVAGADGHVVAANPPDFLPAGVMIPAAARGTHAQSGLSDEQGRTNYWASMPIEVSNAGGAARRTIGVVYVLVRTADAVKGGSAADDRGNPVDTADPGSDSATDTTVGSLVVPGIVVLALLLPVGVLFGLLSTGRLIRRIRRLSQGTAAMAGGDLRARVPVSGGDEVGGLERAFNSMAESLDEAVAEQRVAAGTEARHAERNRIARELHDSISQDLFSVGLVATGMRKALPAGTELFEQAASMERSLARTMREMRALLLQLRPVALEDLGLAAALEELCRVYQARLGIAVEVHVEPAELEPQVEHAVLRVVQEAIGNAIRHGDPAVIELRMAKTAAGIEVTVRDDGRGFDPSSATGRHGMGLDLMRERMQEVGGTADIVSAPAEGTTVTVSLPA